jgi:ATP-binding cassette subfamily B protein
MVLKRLKITLPKPKVSFDRFGQLVFTFKEVTKLALKTNKNLLILAFILNAIWGFSAAPGFYLEKLILDRLVENIGNPNWQTALNTVSILIVVRLLLELTRNILSRVSGFLRRALSRKFDAEINVLIGKKLAELDLKLIEDPDFKNKYDKIERESGRRAWGLMVPLSDIPNYLVGFLSSVGLLILLHPLVSIGIIIVSVPQFLIDRKFIKKDYELDTKLSPLYRIWGWLSGYLVRNRNYLELKILKLSEYLVNKLRKIQEQILNEWYGLQKKRELSRFWSLLPLTLFELGLSLWLVFLVIAKKVTIGSFEMFLRALRNAQANLTGLVSSFLEIYENYIYVSDLVWFLNLKPVIERSNRGLRLKKEKNYSVSLEHVWFKYREDQPWVVKDINFVIEPGERIALVGENGVGKSTLIKLIARFYDPQRGKVFIGKDNLKKINLADWRVRLGVLFQEFETYPFSARETIGYGDVSRINELTEIKEAAKRTDIADYIESLPLGWENPLAPEFEKGVSPSIGQWQRLGISRMLFRKNADILIMDEPTSSVDPKAEEKIFNELLIKTKGKILIFVSQRFSTVRRADRILVMDKGRVTEEGTHEALMKINGLYKELFTIQAKGYK